MPTSTRQGPLRCCYQLHVSRETAGRTIRLLFSLCSSTGFRLHVFHVKHAPLNGPGDLKQLALLALDLARQAEAARPTVNPILLGPQRADDQTGAPSRPVLFFGVLGQGRVHAAGSRTVHPLAQGAGMRPVTNLQCADSSLFSLGSQVIPQNHCDPLEQDQPARNQNDAPVQRPATSLS